MENEKIMVFAELQNGKINSAAIELLCKARELFGEDAQLAFAIAGSYIDAQVRELEASGADAIYFMDDARLEHYHPDYTAAAAIALTETFDPDVLLIGATSLGEELAPVLGSRFGTGVAAHCVDLTLKEGLFMQMVPAFGGKVIGEIYTPGRRPQIASVKPGIFQATPMEQRACKSERVSSDVLDSVNSAITYIDSEHREFEGLAVEKAEMVVCGGYGIGSEQVWTSLEQLASLLGAAVGYTRPVVDSGWVADERGMIGTSGKSVRPKVYLGFGISGATHHLCGIQDAGTIISVNSDSEAEVFKASDYTVKVDASKVIDALIKAIETKSASA